MGYFLSQNSIKTKYQVLPPFQNSNSPFVRFYVEHNITAMSVVRVRPQTAVIWNTSHAKQEINLWCTTLLKSNRFQLEKSLIYVAVSSNNLSVNCSSMTHTHTAEIASTYNLKTPTTLHNVSENSERNDSENVKQFVPLAGTLEKSTFCFLEATGTSYETTIPIRH